MKTLIALLLSCSALWAQPVNQLYVGQQLYAGMQITSTPQTGGGAGTLTNGLVSFWRMDEASSATRVDIVSGNDLANGGTVAQVAGVMTNAADFGGGGGDQLTHADNASLSFSAHDFSMVLFVKLTTAASDSAISGKWASTGEYLIYLNSSTHRFEFYRVNSDGGGNGHVTANSFGAPSTGVWYWIYAGHDYANNQLFIQIGAAGSLTAIDTASYSNAGRDSTDGFTVGQYATGGGFLNGAVDLLGLYSRTLTTTERTNIYNSGAGRDPVTSP